MNEFTIDANFKRAAVGRNELHCVNPGGFANRGCQTGSPRFIVSDHAIFDRNVCLHRELLSRSEVIGPANGGQGDVISLLPASQLSIACRNGRFGFGDGGSTEQIGEDCEDLYRGRSSVVSKSVERSKRELFVTLKAIVGPMTKR